MRFIVDKMPEEPIECSFVERTMRHPHNEWIEVYLCRLDFFICDCKNCPHLIELNYKEI